MRILIIEDNESVAKGIAYQLQDRGHATDLISDGQEADEFLLNDENDLIILDINLPRLDGLTILKNMRSRGDERPVLLLTAKSDTESRVKGLDIGADDYLTKPFEMLELEARLRALSRRRSQKLRTTISLGGLTFDLQSRQLSSCDGVLDLPRRELAVLETLLLARGSLVSKNSLIESVYGTGADVEESAIEIQISRLRKNLKPHGLEIKVQRGLGYRLNQMNAQ